MHVWSINISPHIHTRSLFLVKLCLVPAQIFFPLYNVFDHIIPLHSSLWISAFVYRVCLGYKPFHSSIQFTSSGHPVQQALLCALAPKEIMRSCRVSGQLFSSSVSLSCISAAACSRHTPDDSAGPQCSPHWATCSVGRWWRFALRWCTSADIRPAVCTGWAWCGRGRSWPVGRRRKKFCYSGTDVKHSQRMQDVITAGFVTFFFPQCYSIHSFLSEQRQTWLITTQGSDGRREH